MKAMLKAGAGVLAALMVLALAGAVYKPKTLKGALYQDAAVVDARRGMTCRPDSGAGTVLVFEQEHENPLFPSSKPNKVHLLLHFTQGLKPGRYTLPDSSVKVCYYEQGDLLMFHTFSGEGTVRVDPPKGKSQPGWLDLKLVRPHHNMSNSDYHYMGGNFVATRQVLE